MNRPLDQAFPFVGIELFLQDLGNELLENLSFGMVGTVGMKKKKRGSACRFADGEEGEKKGRDDVRVRLGSV